MIRAFSSLSTGTSVDREEQLRRVVADLAGSGVEDGALDRGDRDRGWPVRRLQEQSLQAVLAEAGAIWQSRLHDAVGVDAAADRRTQLGRGAGQLRSRSMIPSG